jgi:hypothetical protein
MANMSYCRFENTANDLGDCIDAIHDWKENCKDLSSHEVNALRDLLDGAKEIIELEDEIANILDYNVEKIEEYGNKSNNKSS